MSYAIHLKCRDCERTYPLQPLAACEECWAPLEVEYDYGALWSDLRREDLASRDLNARAHGLIAAARLEH